MRHFVSFLGAAALGISVANAADMSVKVPYAMPAPMYNWSGFYIGGDAGWQSSTIGLSNPVIGTVSYDPRHSSFAYGAFAGYQRQFGQFILGGEIGYTAATGSASLGVTPALPIFALGGTGTAQAKLKGIWNIGGRAGWAMGPMGNWLPYITGGYATGSFQFDGQSPGTAETASATASGVYFGAGVDWMAWRNVIAGSDLIVGLEYRHYDFSAKTVTSTFSGGGTEPVRFDPKTDSIMARVSLKFGG